MNVQPASTSPAPSDGLRRYWGLLLVLAVILMVAGVRYRLRDCALERDEGEYAYAGQLMLKGVPPYQQAFNMKFPGTYAAYAVSMAVFGQTPAGIRLGLICVTSLTTLLLYWFGRRLIDEITGVVAAITYALLAASPGMLGLDAHATHFAALCTTAGLCVFWPVRQSRKLGPLLAAGFLFGLAIVMKQQAAMLALWGLGMLVAASLRHPDESNARKLGVFGVFSLGVVLPFALTALILWCAGVFAQFWFWTVQYASEYVSILPIQAIPQMLKEGLAAPLSRNASLWLLALVGLVLLWRDPRLREIRAAIVGFLIASFLTTCPGFYFRYHYFLLLIPALALLAGCAVSTTWYFAKLKSPRFAHLPLASCALLFIWNVCENRDLWFDLTPIQVTRNLHGSNTFPEAETFANYIRSNSVPTEPVAVLGSEPEIFFLAQRPSATGYIYVYALMEPQPFALHMQREMIAQIEAARPKFIVFAVANLSWLQHPDSPTDLIDWWVNSYRQQYTQVGVAEVESKTKTHYVWGPDAAHYDPTHGGALLLFQRNDTLAPR